MKCEWRVTSPSVSVEGFIRWHVSREMGTCHRHIIEQGLHAFTIASSTGIRAKTCALSEFACRRAPASRSEISWWTNGLGDGSPEMVQRDYARVRLIRNTANTGLRYANNQAIRQSAVIT